MLLNISEWMYTSKHTEPAEYTLNILTYYLGPNQFGYEDTFEEGNSYILDLTTAPKEFKRKIDQGLKSGKFPGMWVHSLTLTGEIEYGERRDADDFDDSKYYYDSEAISFVGDNIEELEEFIPNIDWNDVDQKEWFEECLDYFNQYGTKKVVRW